ncbi:MAG: hypothetical protein ACK56F_05950, partial [bacterium]
EIKPLSEEQVKSDSRYHLRTMFKLTVSNDDGVSKHYQCLLCLPKFKLIWTSKTTYQHLEKHVVAVHPAELKRYRELMANKSGENARPHPTSPPATALRTIPGIPFLNGSRPLMVVQHLSCPSTLRRSIMKMH